MLHLLKYIYDNSLLLSSVSRKYEIYRFYEKYKLFI
jgi:hypothetical protein